MSKLIIERHSLEENGKTLSYDLQWSNRKTLEISVHPSGRVAVTAPYDTGLPQIEEKIRKRAAWIQRNIREVEALPQPEPPRQWVSGETHRYMGRQYRLKIETGIPSFVKLQGPFFHIVVLDKADIESIRSAMETWYRNHAWLIFQQRTALCLRTSKPFLGLESVDIVIRKMKRRWGSCTPTGRILLNLDLIKAPVQCIDYIIMHELCHLAVMNHSDTFWRLLSKCMPDWEKRRLILTNLEI